MSKLPKYWCVKNDNSQLFKGTVIKYLTKFYQWTGDCSENYYGVDGGTNYNGTNNFPQINHFVNSPTLLTLEEFIELSKEIEDLNKYQIKVGDSITIIYTYKVIEISEEGLTLQNFWDWVYVNEKLDKKEWTLIKNEVFILPKKWCIKLSTQEITDAVNSINLWGSGNLCWQNTSNYTEYYITNDGKYEIKEDLFKYTEITFDQFKKYVFKQISMKTKKIDYYEILQTVWGLHGSKWNVGNKLYAENEEALPYFKNLGILTDTTIFKPVYKEEEFKVGDICYQNTWTIRANFFPITKIENNLIWGKDLIGKDSSCSRERFIECCRKATPEEVKEYENNLLLEEAKKRYPVGTRFVSAYNGENVGAIEIGTFYIWKEIGIVADRDNGYSVYHKGKWAEILPSYPQISINGYKGEFFDNYVKFGCAKIDKKVFTNANKTFSDEQTRFPNSNKYITSITIGAGTFSKEQIKEIAEYYLNKK